ncbi:MAG: acyl carrier protein [Bacteroidia bacterium]
MSNRQKYNTVFTTLFGVNEKELTALHYQGADNWDSIGHMNMIAELEETFDIMMEIEDILDFSSYLKGFDILKKYGIEL